MSRFIVNQAAYNVSYQWRGNGIYCGECLTKKHAVPPSEVRPVVCCSQGCRDCNKPMEPLYPDMEPASR